VRIATVVLAVGLALGASACTGGNEAAAPTSEETEAQSKILQPGRPGEANETLSPDATVAESEWNDDDAMFVQMMIPHHAQALEMCELAQTRARDERVVSLARRIKGAQGPEILSMSSWLQARDLDVPESMEDVPGHGGHSGMTMPGMLSDAQMKELARAEGRRFDELFLDGMIQHHQGAIDMADGALTSGTDLLANELASDISTGQAAEIDRMREIRQSL
jgi:uncharacterized protein (DUF305 family)